MYSVYAVDTCTYIYTPYFGKVKLSGFQFLTASIVVLICVFHSVCMVVVVINILPIPGYPFGESAGDFVAPVFNNGPTPITLSQPFPFFGENRTVLYVRINGNTDMWAQRSLVLGIGWDSNID